MENDKNKEMSSLIQRTFPAEYRVSSEEGLLTGTPVVFNSPADIGGWFEEEILPGAIDQSVLRDVAFYYNHDIRFSKPHARSRKSKENVGGMDLIVTQAGVEMEARVNRERTDSNDLYIAIQDGTIDGMSFKFRIEKERWERKDTDYPKRIIEKIGYIQEVSAVNYPAYESTHVGVARSDLSLDSDKEALDKVRAEIKSLDSDDKKRSLELEKLKIKIKHGGKN